MELEVLVATMGQENCSLAQKMNITTPAVLANQCDRWGYEESTDGSVRMISTATRGVGLNRNMALQLAKGDILLFADDDVTYYDGALQGVLDAFRQHPDADVICFGIDMTQDGQVVERHRSKEGRVHLWNFLRYGAVRVAIRKSAVVKHRLAFSTLFGGGCIYGCGEDSIFLRDCLRLGLRVYSHGHVLGACAQDASSWFRGFDEKYFFDRGAMVACAFPRAKHIIKWYYILKFSRKSELPLGTAIRQTNMGLRAFEKVQGFE
jgi:glycosyltransferase involved in cell wall biosynthesis